MSTPHDDLQHGTQHHDEPWITYNWPWLVILFGLLFLSLIIFFQPHT
jgi:hypothetical protein